MLNHCPFRIGWFVDYWTWEKTQYWMKWLGFEVLAAVSTKIAVVWVVAPCSLVDVYRRFRGICCLHQIALMMEAARTSETFINFYQTTRRYNPEDSGLRWNDDYYCELIGNDGVRSRRGLSVVIIQTFIWRDWVKSCKSSVIPSAADWIRTGYFPNVGQMWFHIAASRTTSGKWK
jgi:hypothetical protein